MSQITAKFVLQNTFGLTCIQRNVNTEGVCLQCTGQWRTEHKEVPQWLLLWILSECGFQDGIQICSALITEVITIYCFFVDVIYFYCVKIRTSSYSKISVVFFYGVHRMFVNACYNESKNFYQSVQHITFHIQGRLNDKTLNLEICLLWAESLFLSIDLLSYYF
jgi:hypothetical protein